MRQAPTAAVCAREHRSAWRVSMRNYGFPAFQGHVKRSTKDSEVICDRQHGGCGRRWRTTAKYVAGLANYEAPPEPLPVCVDCGRGDLPGNPLVFFRAFVSEYDNRWNGVYHTERCR